MLTSRWRRWSLVLTVVGIVGLAGCSSGGGTSVTPATPPLTSTPAAPGGQAPGGQLVTPAAVAEGLRKIDQTAKEIAQYAGTDKARAVRLHGQIEPVWEPIEDVIKQNDKNAYIAMEDSFAVLEKAADEGDAAAAARGANAFSSAAQAYLAKYAG